MTKRVVKGIAGAAVAMVMFCLLTSCFGIEMQTVFNADGSGRMTLKMRVSRMLLEIGAEEAGVDLPLSSDDLAAQYEKLEGVTVVAVSEEDTDEDRIITVVIDFEDFNILSSDDELPGEESSLELENGRSILRILVGRERSGQEGATGEDTGPGGDLPSDMSDLTVPPEMDESMMAMMQSFMEGYTLEYRIVAPTKIAGYSHGEVERDGRTLVYTLPMGDFIMIEEPYYLEVVW